MALSRDAISEEHVWRRCCRAGGERGPTRELSGGDGSALAAIARGGMGGGGALDGFSRRGDLVGTDDARDVACGRGTLATGRCFCGDARGGLGRWWSPVGSAGGWVRAVSIGSRHRDPDESAVNVTTDRSPHLDRVRILEKAVCSWKEPDGEARGGGMAVPRAWAPPVSTRNPSGRRFFWRGAPLARSSQTAASLLSAHRLTASPHFSMSGSHEG